MTNIIASQKSKKPCYSHPDGSESADISPFGDHCTTQDRIYGILSLLKEREMLRSSVDQNITIATSHAAAEMAAELLEEVLRALDK